MSLEEQVRSAVAAELWTTADDARSESRRVADAIVAAARVVAVELGGGQRDVGPALELPTELTEAVDPPLLATLYPAADEDGIPWYVAGLRWVDPEEITGWVPALVVRDDEQGPAAALREVVRLLDGPQNDAAQAAQDTARRALAAIEGTTP